jgi:tight adherence protein C
MDVWLVLFVSTAFVSVAGLTFSVGHLVTSRNRLQRRLPAGVRMADALTVSAAGDDAGALAGEPFKNDRFGIGQRLGKELRLKLVRAGYFSPRAVRDYVFGRICAVIAAPVLVLLGSALLLRDLSTLKFALAAALSVGVGVLGPDAYLSRRQSWQIAEYRLNFPDLLDLLTVCVTAGLTVEASFARIRDRLGKRSPALGHNIELMGAEMRAGRSSVDALSAFAERLGLEEASSFVAVLRHSVELGGDVATTLGEFSEDMRSKRMLLAEKKANELPVKMVVPLALGIFPVILMIVLLPVILKLLKLIAS